jgi:hypothetical protein
LTSLQDIDWSFLLNNDDKQSQILDLAWLDFPFSQAAEYTDCSMLTSSGTPAITTDTVNGNLATPTQMSLSVDTCRATNLDYEHSNHSSDSADDQFDSTDSETGTCGSSPVLTPYVELWSDDDDAAAARSPFAPTDSANGTWSDGFDNVAVTPETPWTPLLTPHVSRNQQRTSHRSTTRCTKQSTHAHAGHGVTDAAMQTLGNIVRQRLSVQRRTNKHKRNARQHSSHQRRNRTCRLGSSMRRVEIIQNPRVSRYTPTHTQTDTAHWMHSHTARRVVVC